jgi:excisionase family DNA binding protein
MSEPAKHPFDALLDTFREVVREELAKLKPEPVPLLLDVEAAAKLLRVAKTWVAAAARDGKIPSLKLGHYVRFKKSELENILRHKTARGKCNQYE